MTNLSTLEIDLLLLFYTFSDQYGKVDMRLASAYASAKLGVILPNRQVVIRQKHIDALIDAGQIPDTKSIFKKAAMASPPKSKRKKNPK